MAIKTTRLKNVQLPKIETIDLSSQMNGYSQTFSTGRRITDQDIHHIVWNSTVYRNSPSRTWYEISRDGVVTTYFDTAPAPGPNHTLLLVISERQGESPTVSEEELTEAINATIKKAEDELAEERTSRTEKDSELEEKIVSEAERANQAEGWLQQNINSEVEARMQDRDALQQNINAEVEARTKADEELSKGLNDENKRAYNAEQELQQKIENVDDQLADKQDTLVSGANIKTINGESILGEGDMPIVGGGADYLYQYTLSADNLNQLLYNVTTDSSVVIRGNVVEKGDEESGANIPLTTLPVATSLKAGVMSAADKAKLDSLSGNIDLSVLAINPKFIQTGKVLTTIYETGVEASSTEVRFSTKFDNKPIVLITPMDVDTIVSVTVFDKPTVNGFSVLAVSDNPTIGNMEVSWVAIDTQALPIMLKEGE